MKPLFDQGTPAPLRKRLSGHEVDTLAEKGWTDKDNGELLDLAEGEGYNKQVTTDQSLRHQQNIAGRKIGIVVLLAPNWPRIRRRAHDVGRAITVAQPGEVIEVPCWDR